MDIDSSLAIFERVAPSRKADLTEKAYRYLREQIVELRLAPGARVGEAEAARRLGMSRGPVREALRKLESFGFVVREENRGARVAEFDLREMDELDVLRTHLLALGGRLAAQGATPPQLRAAQGVLEKMGTAVQAEDYAAYTDLNFQFHNLLSEMAGNVKLAQHLAQVYQQIRRYHLVAMTFPAVLRDSFESHRRILAAVEEGDPIAAERELSCHGRLSYELLRSNFEKLWRALRPAEEAPRPERKNPPRNHRYSPKKRTRARSVP